MKTIKKIAMLLLILSFGLFNACTSSPEKRPEDSGETEVTFTVTFDSVGGTQIESQQVKKNKNVVKPNDPTKESTSTEKYEFDGWYYGTTLWNFDTGVTSDIELKAKWKTVDISTGETIFTITFDTDGGTPIESQKVKKNEKIIRPDDPTKESTLTESYEFNGWCFGEALWDFDYGVASDMELKVRWKVTDITPQETTFTVTFNSDGGTTVATQKVKENEKIIKPDDPTKESTLTEEYEFDGWYYNDTLWDFNSGVTSNMELKAKWKVTDITPQETTFTITFNSDGGTTVATQKVKENEKIVKPDDPTKTTSTKVYEFVGWYYGDTLWDFNTGVTSDMELKAKWKVIEEFTEEFLPSK